MVNETVGAVDVFYFFTVLFSDIDYAGSIMHQSVIYN